MSYAEDYGYDAFDGESMYWEEIEDDRYWVGSEGPLEWDDVDDEYLENIVTGLKAGKWESQTHKLKVAERELLKRRPKRWYE